MWTDAGPLRQLRAAVRAALPPRAFLRRDRGDALFVTNAPAFDPALREIPGFIAERRGGLMHLLPDASWIVRWERRAPEPPDDLCAKLQRFRNTPPDRDNLLLLARGLKLLDGGATPEEISAYDQSLRQRAAIALRGGCGGGLYAAALFSHRLNRKEGRTMKLQYYGHACFTLRLADGTTLAIDPFDPSIPYPVCDATCDAALLSHGHFDHNYTQSLSGDFVTIDAPGTYSVGGAKITAVPCFHDKEGGAKRGKNLIFRIEAEGLSVAHLGDLGHMPNDEQLAALKGLDLMLIPIGGFYTIDTPEAEEIISLAKPRCAVAMHYKIHADDPNPISDSAAFAADMNAARMPHEIEITAESASALPPAIIMDYK